ncbi:MAG: diguanylate cyclase [Sulfurimonadaceae bacterium]
MQKKIFLLLFLLFGASLLYLGNTYKAFKVEDALQNRYAALAQSLDAELAMMIQEKKNATLSIAVSLARGHNLQTALKAQKSDASFLRELSADLKKSTDFKNVWIQLIDKNGINKMRSWTERTGDNLAFIRSDVFSMIRDPKIRSSVSVGWFDLSFKAMAPVYDTDNSFLGFLEVVTHFNSIARKIEEKGFKPLIALDPKFKSQIIAPYTKIFALDHYIANENADEKLVSLLAEKGISAFVSPLKNHLVNERYLILNHPILDHENSFLANFLVFVPLEKIDDSSIQALKTNVNLFLIFFFILGSFLFYSFYKNINKNSVENPTLYASIFLFLFLSLSGVYFLVLSWYFESQKNEFITTYDQNVVRDFKIITGNYSHFARSTYTLIINKPQVLDLLKEAYKGQKQKAEAREKLYLLLYKEYDYLTKSGLKQLHFQLKDNESFLRFHRPKKFGDNLSGIRATIEYVNKNLVGIEGFEEGRIFNGFRHVYPLMGIDDQGRSIHLGSVEISFSAFVLTQEFTRSHEAKAGFVISQKEVEKKVFANEKSNYEPSPFEGFLYESSIVHELEKTFSHIQTAQLAKSDIKQAAARIHEGEVFSLIAEDGKSIFTFVPFKNPVTKKVASAIILQEDTRHIGNLAAQYSMLLVFGITAILFLLLYLYKELSSSRSYRTLLKKTQNILDAQDAIVVVTDGKSIIDANKKFFDFFGFESLESFKQHHACICDCFEKDPKFFHIDTPQNNVSWVSNMLRLPAKEHIVSMRSKDKVRHSFALSISSFEENYIISFSDISETIDEQFMLEAKAMHDALTNAYNREYFRKIFPRFLVESRERELQLGIIIFDIDHFKSVNDTYGHNAGDAILKHLVKTVHKSIRSEDILVRWGGEEFIVLAKIRSLQDVSRLAETIRTRVAKEHFEEVEHITCSFGVCVYSEAETIEEAIARADEGLYKAKREGRNRVVVAS